MAAIQPFVNLQPFKGTEKENLEEFIRQLESCMHVAGIANADRHRYLHLHLKGGALSFFDQQPDATRNDYDVAIPALRERYLNDQRVQLQKLLFQARKMKTSDESAQDFLTDLQRLAIEAYPDVAARAAAGGRPAVVAEDRAQERNRRIKEAFINGMPTQIKRFLLTQPDETTVEDLCSKAASRMIVDRLYPEDDDSAFNEISSFSTKDLLAGIHELSKAQDTLKQETSKLSTEMKQMIESLTPVLNNQNQQQNNRNFNQRGNNNNNQQRPNNQKNNQNKNQNWQNRNQNWKNRNQNNQPRNNNNNNNNQYARSGRIHCNICNRFGHPPSKCWFRNPPGGPAALPYNQMTTQAFQYQNMQPSMMQQPQQQVWQPYTMSSPWSNPYGATQNNQNQKN